MPDSDRTIFYRPPATPGASVAKRAAAFLEHHRWARAGIIGLASAALAAALWSAGLFERPELSAYDWRARAFAPGGRSTAVEVIDYDETTVQRFEKTLGPWGQWPRGVHADLIKALERGKPRVIVFDILFAGSSESADEDDLVEVCRANGNVVMAASLNPSRRGGADGAGQFDVLPEAQAARLSLGPAQKGAADMQAASWPFPALCAASRAVGSVGLEADRDETARAVSPALNYAGRLWPAASTAAASVYWGERPEVSGGSLLLGGKKFPLEPGGRRLLRWYGPNTRVKAGAEPYFHSAPAGAILDAARRKGDVDSLVKGLEGKVVVVGCSAAGGFDHRDTPIGREPGHFIHATAIENLIRGDSVRRAWSGWSIVAAFVVALGAAAAFAAASVRRAPFVGSMVALGLMGIWAALSCLLYSRGGLWTEFVLPEVAAALALGGSLLAGYIFEGRQARRLRKGFARFLSPEVLAEVAGDLDSLRPGMGRRREITVMFCDARGFTALSERVSPEAAVEVLDAYLGAMSDCILGHGGTLSKYIGDGIMAFWNAPGDCPDHPQRAARAALAMVQAQEELKKRLAAAGKPSFNIGIGLHIGEAVVGTVGSEKRLDYTAIGDTVNLASRVEGLTKDFGVRICATFDFFDRAGEGFEFRELGRVNVKGRTAGVEILELVRERAGGRPASAPGEDGFAVKEEAGK